MGRPSCGVLSNSIVVYRWRCPRVVFNLWEQTSSGGRWKSSFCRDVLDSTVLLSFGFLLDLRFLPCQSNLQRFVVFAVNNPIARVDGFHSSLPPLSKSRPHPVQTFWGSKRIDPIQCPKSKYDMWFAISGLHLWDQTPGGCSWEYSCYCRVAGSIGVLKFDYLLDSRTRWLFAPQYLLYSFTILSNTYCTLL